MGGAPSKDLQDFGQGFVNGLSGGVNLLTGAFGIPEIPIYGDPDTALFGHKAEKEKRAQEEADAKHEDERRTALENIKQITTPPLQIPDVKPTGGRKDYNLPPVIQPTGQVVSLADLEEAKNKARVEQEFMLGALGAGSLAVLFLLK